jgi:hypothetical protein
MKAIWWALVAFAALAWTGGAWVAAGLTEWGAQALASGAAMEAGRAAAQWPVPPWVELWIDPAWVAAAQESVRWTLDALGHLLPAVGSVGPWLVAAVWVLWAVGMVGGLLIGVLGHLALRRWSGAGRQGAMPMASGLASGASGPR